MPLALYRGALQLVARTAGGACDCSQMQPATAMRSGTEQVQSQPDGWSLLHSRVVTCRAGCTHAPIAIKHSTPASLPGPGPTQPPCPCALVLQGRARRPGS